METDASLSQPTSAGAFVLEKRNSTQRRLSSSTSSSSWCDDLRESKARRVGWEQVHAPERTLYLWLTSNSKHLYGSSDGSAVSVAAGFAPFSIGTEDTGSKSCPALYTSLHGLKASVVDIANLLTVLSGEDAEDAETIRVADHKWLSGLNGFTGEMWGVDDEEKMLQAAFSAVNKMRDLGTTRIDNVTYPSARLAGSEAQMLARQIISEFPTLIRFFENFMSLLNGTEFKTLADLLEFNNQHPEQAFSKITDCLVKQNTPDKAKSSPPPTPPGQKPNTYTP
ncbi:hypothetical protein VTL71DRAFT_5286 [Oculimacula yallundae]|uniref:Amidase domain-containing protein n=1 Tax=Oculimacula yallundae TaxID=86028 RepID=A0ABR4C263_9HELO